MGGADRGEDQRDLVALDQPPRLLHRLRRRVAVVERDQIDLAAVDAAALVEHLEIADLALAERAERRHRPAVGHGLADLDFGRGDAAHFGGDRGRRPSQHGKRADAPNLVTKRIDSPPLYVSARSDGGRGRRGLGRRSLCQRKHAMTAAMDANHNHDETEAKTSAACIKKRGVAAAFSVQDGKPLHACGCGSRPASGSGRGRGLPAGGTAEARGVVGSSTNSRFGFLPLSRS